ncbi:VOC family protein [Micromonospora sp. KC207]|uniref:VOC family protein n=1 Tax=Micromonospora sp. KC207 TaxID=2530377 RepID=UPI0014049E79|nr:VOC family protein [Micromonospora sp. KC207]
MASAVTVRFGGLVIGSADPQRLSAWYHAALAPDSEPGDVLGRPVVEVGGARLVFDKRADVADATTEPGRILINLFTPDIQGAAAHLEGFDVRWVRPVETLPDFGSVGTFTDPDGNYVQLLSPAGPPAGA